MHHDHGSGKLFHAFEISIGKNTGQKKRGKSTVNNAAFIVN